MLQKGFTQTSSIINRLRMVMIVIAIFIIFCTFALYLSSLNTLHGLKNLNNANNQLNLNSQIFDSLNSVEGQIDKLRTNTDSFEIKYSIDENLKVIKKLIADSRKLAPTNLLLVNHLQEIEEILNQLQLSQELLFKKILLDKKIKTNIHLHNVKAEILVTKQLVMDAKDLLRKIQILVKKDNDQYFNSVYESRFTPLIVGMSLAALFFIFVVFFGLSISKRIGRSISSLLNATDIVSQGDLDYKVQILEKNEIGRLAYAFNQMTASLKIGQDQLNLANDRTLRLQAITASFSEALTLYQVYDIIFKQAFESLSAKASSISTVSEDRKNLEIKRLEGYNSEALDKWKSFSLSTDVPSAKVIRTREPLFLDKNQLKKFSAVSENDVAHETHSFACLPLIISGEAFGALSFSFAIDKTFDQYEKDFMIALARQCAQAIHRSELYDNAKKAIEARDEFLSIASHELRTPLTPLKLQIQSLAKLVKSKEPLDFNLDRIKKTIDTSDRQVNRLSILIDDLLDVSRITSGKLTLKKDFFSLKEMIDEVVTQYSQQLRDSRSNTDIIVQQDSIGFWDKLRIEQVVTNILMNASKYAPNKPIHITVTRTNGNHGQMAKIQIQDEGPGISHADRDRIFKRFERVSSRENVGGLGLGLYISRQIIEAHKGRIYVDSTQGKGSIFTIELPEEKFL